MQGVGQRANNKRPVRIKIRKCAMFSLEERPMLFTLGTVNNGCVFKIPELPSKMTNSETIKKAKLRVKKKGRTHRNEVGV